MGRCDLSQPGKDFRSGNRLRLPGVETGDPPCNLGLPGGVRAGFRIGLHAQEKAISDRDALISRQNKRVVRDRFERRGHEPA